MGISFSVYEQFSLNEGWLYVWLLCSLTWEFIVQSATSGVCDGFGDPQYLTFDRSNYTFNGNCTYVAARDVNPHGKHTFQVGSFYSVVIFVA